MLKKIFWLVLTIILLTWAGIGIYFLKTNRQVVLPKVGEPQEKRGLAPTSSPTEALIQLRRRVNSLQAVAGSFNGWQELTNSPDRHLFLGETVFSSAQKFGSYPKIRVVFAPNSFLASQGGTKRSTLLAMKKDGQEQLLGYLEDFDSKRIDELIKPGDFIKVTFLKGVGETEILKDEDGNFLAKKILLP